jgi:endogenous inhibitor of DNA gyrase (YacG/DUF329 family)
MSTEPVERVAVPCQECGIELAADSPELRLELTCGDPVRRSDDDPHHPDVVDRRRGTA